MNYCNFILHIIVLILIFWLLFDFIVGLFSFYSSNTANSFSYYYDLIVLRLYSPNYYFYSYPGSIHTIWVPSKTVTALFIYTPALCFHPHSSLYTSALLWQVQISENLLPLLDSVQVFRFLGNTRRDLLWHFNPTCFSRVTED